MIALRKPLEERSEAEATFLNKSMKSLDFFHKLRKQVDKPVFKGLFKLIRYLEFVF